MKESSWYKLKLDQAQFRELEASLSLVLDNLDATTKLTIERGKEIQESWKQHSNSQFL